MCDDFTAKADATSPDQKGVSRRQFGALGAAAAIVAYAEAGCAATASLRETAVRIPTPDGTADALFIHPARGRHPGVIVWPDVGGPREAINAIGRRLAADGYAVLVVNQYYRGGPGPHLTSFAEWRTPEGQAKLRPLIAGLSPAGTMRDAAAFVAFLDRQRSVDLRRKIGSQGYCQGGATTIRTAAAAPARVGAAASFHGGGLASDKPDSPHLLLPETRAAYLVAVAQNDDARDSGEKDRFRAAATAAERTAEIEVYAADHGWCVPDSPSYNKLEADRAWGRLLALYRKL